MFPEMNSDRWIAVGLAAYLLTFMGGVLCFAIWRTKRRGGRLPVDFKLLRGPGETLRRRIAKYDDEFGARMGGAALAPIIALAPIMWGFERFKPQTWPQLWAWVSVIAGVFIGGLVLALRWAFRDFVRYRADRLGFLGERHVAEQLQPLIRKGYALFHDVPAEGKKTMFNLDHVAVGPAGVALIETKTKRKGKPRADRGDYRVVSDGEKLKWPWGSDSSDLEQAVAQAKWLEEFLTKRTGIHTPVKAILAIPGWWVEESARKTVAVVNAKSVAQAVEGRAKQPLLTPEQIDLISRQLDERCRDVED